MRTSAAHSLRFFAVLSLALAVPGGVFADTIYLKSGRKITATHVIEENGQVSYETSAGRFSFPASIVDRVTHDDAPPVSAAAPSPRIAPRTFPLRLLMRWRPHPAMLRRAPPFTMGR